MAIPSPCINILIRYSVTAEPSDSVSNECLTATRIAKCSFDHHNIQRFRQQSMADFLRCLRAHIHLIA